MASGKPVVSTKVGAIPEVVDDKALRERLGAAGRLRVVGLFGWGKIVCGFVGAVVE